MKYWISWIICGAALGFAQLSSNTTRPLAFSTKQFKLLIHSKGFALQFLSAGRRREIAIPRGWLVPPDEESAEQGNYVLSFNYNARVTSFPLGNGRVGLHLSSYDIAREGTSQAAAGRDVFLILDPHSLQIFNGGLRSGITKSRVRSEGCISAASERFYLADIDGDGLTDIGVLREEFRCIDGAGRYGNIAGPFYQRYPMSWYVLKETSWKLDTSYSERTSDSIQELPMIGIGDNPPAVTGCGLSASCDRSKWPHEIKTISVDGVTAHFAGEQPPENAALRLGVEALWFTFEGDPENYGYPASGEDGELYFDDWGFDIFSPDGAYVLLLQSHYGPYHVVAVNKLKAYLTGGRKPDFIVTKDIGPGESARVHHDAHWISSRDIEFEVSCCGTSETIRYSIANIR